MRIFDLFKKADNHPKTKLAFFLILSFGIVSMLGDIVYEGAMSIYGIFLNDQKINPVNIGILLGSAEFLGYIIRIISGILVDRFRWEWSLVFVGYGLLLSIPALAFTTNPNIIILMIFLERIGKNLRAPARDSLVSHATKKIGTGFGFGILEALDQIGAFIGPLIFALSLSYSKSYTSGFIFMLIPIVFMLLVLFNAYKKIPQPHKLETMPNTSQQQTNYCFNKAFFYYMAFIFTTIIGFTTFPVLSIHIANTDAIDKEFIPLLYAIAMIVDGLIAIPIGKCYDNFKGKLLFLIPLITIPAITLVFSQLSFYIFIGIILWGAVMGIHEVVLKAYIADFIPKTSRGRAYACYSIVYGTAILLSNTLIGYLYCKNPNWIFLFVITSQIIALSLLYTLNKKYNRQNKA